MIAYSTSCPGREVHPSTFPARDGLASSQSHASSMAVEARCTPRADGLLGQHRPAPRVRASRVTLYGLTHRPGQAGTGSEHGDGVLRADAGTPRGTTRR